MATHSQTTGARSSQVEAQFAGSRDGGAGRIGPGQAWNLLRNPATTSEFYAAWLTLLCGGIQGAVAGLLLVRAEDGSFLPAGIWPDTSADPSHLRPAAERALVDRASVLLPHASPTNGDAAVSRVHVAHPIITGDELLGVVVIDLMAAKESEWRTAIEQLAWAVGWPEAVFWRQRAQPKEPVADRSYLAIDVLRAADQHDRFEVAAVLVANRIAQGLDCERVTIGLVGRRGIAVKAMSHSATFDKKSDLVRGLEAAMQEAYDQHDAVSFPPVATTERRINVAHAHFAEQWKVGGIASVLMLAAGRAIGVVTIERRPGQPIDKASVDLARILADALGPVLDLKHRQGRWISGRLAEATRDGIRGLFGSHRLSLKIASLAAVLLIAFMAVWPSEFRISARAVLEGSVQRAAVAPFDGFISRAPLRAGDVVKAGQELAALDDRDLLLEKLKWETERQKLVQKQRDALAKHERTNLLVLGTQIEQSQSQLDLALEKLKRSRIAAPIDGVIVSGDLSQMLGGPVSQGKVLFEIAPLSSYRLILQVDERDIGHVEVGKRGVLLLTGAAARGIAVEITKLTSVATPEDGRNYFRVEASLAESDQPLRPGMEGIAKIAVGERSLLWIWARPLIDRVRMLAWTWLP